MSMRKDTHVRHDAGEQTADSISVIGGSPRAELPAALPDPDTTTLEPDTTTLGKSLGPALTIREVARLIGCSVWTVRRRCLRAGLPCIRSGPRGKLIFYRNQVIRWLLSQQRKGGVLG